VHGIAVVKCEVNKRCANDASRIKVTNKADAVKITNVVGTRPRDRGDLIRESKMRIKNETKIASRGSSRDTMAITEDN